MGRNQVDEFVKLLRETAAGFRETGNSYLSYGEQKEDVEFLGIGKGYHAGSKELEDLATKMEGEEEAEEEEEESLCQVL